MNDITVSVTLKHKKMLIEKIYYHITGVDDDDESKWIYLYADNREIYLKRKNVLFYEQIEVSE